jgi:hypothetical protein
MRFSFRQKAQASRALGIAWSVLGRIIEGNCQPQFNPHDKRFIPRFHPDERAI